MKRDEYYIGMSVSKNGTSRYRRRRKRRNAKIITFRILEISVCVLLIAAVTAGVWFLVSAISTAAGKGDTGETLPVATVPTDKAPSEPQNTEAPTAVTTVPVTTTPNTNNSVLVFNKPDIKDNGASGDFISNAIYLWNNKAYNIFGSSEKIAKNYSSGVNYIAKKLGSDVKVYDIVVPNQVEFGLPSRIVESVGGHSQAENIKCIYENLSDDVIPVNCYNVLSEHCNEYIYFGTDHHWTSLGSYYAYTAFCDRAGLTPMTISDDKCEKVAGFTGAFYTATSSPALLANPDTVYFYDLPNDTYAYLREKPDSERLTVDVYYPGASSGTLTYGAFCWGDVSEFIIHSDCNTGKKVAVIKDSYGNAFAPYLTANYDEVHLIDFRYWKGELPSYLKSNGITDVIIINNTMSANAPDQVDTMKELVG